MKRITLIALLLSSLTTVLAQTADDVINKFIEASGGKEKLNGINTLHYNQLIKFSSPMGELELPVELVREKNKLYRMQISMQMGPQSMESFTLITDTAGYNMLPANPFTGATGGIQKMEAKDLKSQGYQLDAAGMFPALVDYAAKGHKAELLKDEKVNKQECYKLKVTLASGQELDYYINKTTNLVDRLDVKGAMAASMSGLGSMLGGMVSAKQMEKMSVTTDYKEYKDFDGIKFPTKLVIKTQMGDSQSELTNIQVNQPLPAKWYKAE